MSRLCTDLELLIRMQNRTELQSEYLKLINKLNKSNRNKNQWTELSFIFRTDSTSNKSLFCTVNHQSFLRIAYSNLQHSWYADINFEYQELANYILQNNNLNSPEACLTIANSLRNIFAI